MTAYLLTSTKWRHSTNGHVAWQSQSDSLKIFCCSNWT